MIRYRYNRQVTPPAPFVYTVISNIDNGAETEPFPSLVDSGADSTVVPMELIGALNLREAGAVQVSGVNQVTGLYMPLYILNISISGMPPITISAIGAAGEDYVLLGRDVLNQYRIVLDGPRLLCIIGAEAEENDVT